MGRVSHVHLCGCDGQGRRIGGLNSILPQFKILPQGLLLIGGHQSGCVRGYNVFQRPFYVIEYWRKVNQSRLWHGAKTLSLIAGISSSCRIITNKPGARAADHVPPCSRKYMPWHHKIKSLPLCIVNHNKLTSDLFSTILRLPLLLLGLNTKKAL